MSEVLSVKFTKVPNLFSLADNGKVPEYLWECKSLHLKKEYVGIGFTKEKALEILVEKGATKEASYL